MENKIKNLIKVFHSQKPVIGVIHLPALPRYKEHPGMKAVIEKALIDLNSLQQAGFNGVLVENDGDHPPHIGKNRSITRYFEQVMQVILEQADIPIGMEILYDMQGSVELACKLKADFVRLDVFADEVQTRYGPIIYGQGKKLDAIRQRLYPDLLLFTDIQVKHTVMIDQAKSLVQSAKEAIEAGSDGIIITGSWTGEEPFVKDLKTVKKITDDVPVFIGSGFSSNNARKFMNLINGVIVASSIKTGEYIDLVKAQKLVKKVRELE